MAESGLGNLPRYQPVGLGLLLPSALRPKPQPDLPEFSEITIDADNDNNVSIDPKSGAITIINEDGTIDVDFSPEERREKRASKFNDNLAEIIDPGELGHISNILIEGIQQDDMSRQEWLNDRAQGIRLLGLKLKDPRSSIDTTTALEGMSSVDHPLLLEAVLTFWANSSGELLPAAGPVKVAAELDKSPEQDELAEKLEDGLNYYLTSVATEYYPDTSRALLNVGFGGLVVKKVYNCPLRQRPVSEAIDAPNLIVSNAATDLRNSGRYTHVVTMRPSVLRRMQLAGAYRDVPLVAPSGVVPNPVTQTIADQQGVTIVSQQTEDREHTIWECYCELNIRGFEDEKNGKPTGLQLPYRVVIDKDSQQILEVRRNWDEVDPTKTAKDRFVVYMLIPGFGFYGIGLLNILGNTTKALTAAERETLDNGMFANFPGFLFSKLTGRQNTNEFRVPPGGGQGVEHAGDDIRKSIMPLPYKETGPGFMQFQKDLTELGRSLGGSAQIQVSEGRQDAPVGTTLAMIEQATRVEKATHKELWRAQCQEFMLLKECFRENPEAFIRALAKRGQSDWDTESFLAALNDANLVPQADPNTPSHMHRLMKAMGMIQIDKQYPGVLDPVAVVENAMTMMGIGNFDALRNKNPQAGGIPPELQAEMAKLQLQGRQLDDKQVDRMFKAWVETQKSNMARFQAEQAEANRRHEAKMQLQESWDQTQDRMARLHESQTGLREQEIESSTDLKVEDTRARTEDIRGKHAVNAEKAREQTEDTKGEHAVNVAKAKPGPAGKK